MADGFPIQTNWTAGELDPAMLGRPDVAKFFNGAIKLENYFVLPQGGAMFRSGTKFLSEIKDSSKWFIPVA